jgi:aminoglycoside 2'-N-acetyltransferase I
VTNTGTNTVINVAHTGALDEASLAAGRALLYDVFDDMTEADWEHSLGGLHALAWDGPTLIGHAALVQRRIIHNGQALRAGYIEGVAVRADRRGQGHGAALMAALEPILRRAYDLGALGATDEATSFYAARGWRVWTGPLSALTPTGIHPTPDEHGGVYVLPLAVPLDPTGELTCDWRDGDTW